MPSKKESRRKAWEDGEEDLAVRLAEDGKTVREISLALGRTHQSVTHRLKIKGAPIHATPKKFFQYAEKPRARVRGSAPVPLNGWPDLPADAFGPDVEDRSAPRMFLVYGISAQYIGKAVL